MQQPRQERVYAGFSLLIMGWVARWRPIEVLERPSVASVPDLVKR